MPESYLGGPDSTDPRAVYAEGKRIGETRCACATRALGLEAVIARAFAFVGPHLPVDRHFAVGNFVRDALARRPIVVLGDGTAIRSYQYAADMAVWLWALLVRGTAGRAYNVGASNEINIGDLARLIAHLAETRAGVDIRKTPTAGARVDRYVPDVRLGKETLGLEESISIEDGIERTLRWHRSYR
jgi:dTDP-glucose 4,6-dehydratase